MLRTIYAIAAAAIVAGAFVTALSIADQVDARGSAPGAKADRADTRPLAGQCSQNAWPYFEASCLRDARNPFGQARDVRLVSWLQRPRPSRHGRRRTLAGGRRFNRDRICAKSPAVE